MKSKLIKSKLFVIAVSVLLLAAVVPITRVFAATTWYVDDSGGADFTTINAAVAVAVAGDTIIVKDGTYIENMVVNKSLTIQSENGFTTTFVQAASTSADVFRVTMPNVTIDGFTVSGATSTGRAGIHIFGASVGSCKIKNNLCTGNSYGISIDPDYVGGNIIINNTCASNGRYGIELMNTVGNTISGNTVYDHTLSSGYGIYLADNADGNTVTDNTCYSNIYGIRVKNADSNIIFNNAISNNNYGTEWATGSIGNVFYLNNLINSTTTHVSIGFGAVAGNFWNSQEQIEYWFDGAFYTGYMGNYWDTYSGTDVDGNGIGDTPYPTFTAEFDNYPLIGEFAPYFQLPPQVTSASVNVTADIIMAMVGIELDRDSIDYGNVAPGESSGVETVGITNVGTVDVDVTLEVDGADATAQSFYEQSLYIDGAKYNVTTVIASIPVEGSENVGTQLQVPLSWAETGVQDATFIFWAGASP